MPNLGPPKRWLEGENAVDGQLFDWYLRLSKYANDGGKIDKLDKYIEQFMEALEAMPWPEDGGFPYRQNLQKMKAYRYRREGLYDVSIQIFTALQRSDRENYHLVEDCIWAMQPVFCNFLFRVCQLARRGPDATIAATVKWASGITPGPGDRSAHKGHLFRFPLDSHVNRDERGIAGKEKWDFSLPQDKTQTTPMIAGTFVLLFSRARLHPG